MDRDQVITLLRQHLPSLAAQYGVKRIGLFGSFVKGLPDSSSDVDLVVEFERPIGFKFVELAEYLELLRLAAPTKNSWAIFRKPFNGFKSTQLA